jgi:GNAT superfamily N-acetyltransferase
MSSNNVIFENIARSIQNNDNHLKYKNMLSELGKLCIPELNQQFINQAYGIIEEIAYIKDKNDKIKAYAFTYPIEYGANIKTKKSISNVKILAIKIICVGGNYRNRGYARKLIEEIEDRSKSHGYRYTIIEEPTENAKPFYDKLEYKYEEQGELDGITLFDYYWKKM